MEEIGLGILIGLGMVALKKRYRPVVKGAIKIGLTAGEALKEAVHEGGEQIGDLFAEARQEVQAARGADAASAHAPEEPKPDAN